MAPRGLLVHESSGSARPWWEDDPPPDDGLGTFVAVATGRAPVPEPDNGDDDDAGPGLRRWWQQPRPWQAVPRGVLLAGAAGAVVLVLIAAGLVNGGGPTVDPALPVAGASPADVAEGTGGRPAGASSGAEVTPGTGGSPPAAAAAPAGGEAPTTLVVHVAGAVVSPGVHRLPAGSRVHEAIAAAGGPLPEADLNRLNLAAPLSDGSQVHVTTLGAPPGPAGVSGSAGGVAGGAAGGSGPVSLSTADQAALDALPGVGPSTAAAIIAHREANGPFGSVEELLEVRGIGEAKLDGLRDLVVP